MQLTSSLTLELRYLGRALLVGATSRNGQRFWGHRVQLHRHQNQKTRFDNLAGGHRISTSEGGMITGEGAM